MFQCMCMCVCVFESVCICVLYLFDFVLPFAVQICVVLKCRYSHLGIFLSSNPDYLKFSSSKMVNMFR